MKIQLKMLSELKYFTKILFYRQRCMSRQLVLKCKILNEEESHQKGKVELKKFLVNYISFNRLILQPG